MNAVMPAPSPQLSPTYGIGPDEIDPLPLQESNGNFNPNSSNSNNNNHHHHHHHHNDGGPPPDAMPPTISNHEKGMDPNHQGHGSSSSHPSNPSNPNTNDPRPNRQRQPSSSSTSSIPLQVTPENLPLHQQSQQHQLQSPTRPPPAGVPVPHSPVYGGPPPFGLGPQPMADPKMHPVDPAFPWSIGSTDGSFALISLQEQHHQLLQQQQYQLQQALGASGNNNATSSSSNNNSSNVDEDPGTFNSANLHPGPEGVPATGGSGDGSRDGSQALNNNSSAVNGGGSVTGVPMSSVPTAAQAAIAQAAEVIQAGRSLYHDKLFHQSSSSVEAVLAATCEVMGFDIAEMWLRTGLKTHQLTNSHLRPTALQDSVRQEVVDVYYGDRSNERTHRLSPALCKRAKDANDVVWVTAHTQNGAEALRMSISNVRTAVAVPVCHEASNTNVTIIYFSLRRIALKPPAVEFLIHMSLSAAVTSVNALDKDGLLDRAQGVPTDEEGRVSVPSPSRVHKNNWQLSKTSDGVGSNRMTPVISKPISYQRADRTSITGARLDLQWRQLLNVEYLTDGGNSWIHTAVFDGKPVVVKTLRPECQDSAQAISEIEAEVAVHARLNHPNVVSLIGAGWTSKKVRFIVLERLDGGTLTQMLGYDTRIRDRRRRFWRKKQLPYLDVLRCARSLAFALQYCHEQAVPGSMVLHRDLKPDNIGFTLDGKPKLIDFGLARMLENSDPKSNDTYEMSGETGSLRYMAPEVAEGLPYNHKADVYSFGVILWEMNSGNRPFNGLSRDTFYEQVVHGGERPHLSKKWPPQLNKLIADCWSDDIQTRPSFGEIVDIIDDLLTNEKGGKAEGKSKAALRRFSNMIDRHSTWF
mmetsp:Transcript_7719/g.22605  ORF Transcript_7719/g.22605 Transcript_7719/m.22605 type:complete len:863 (+) Transcript_7719:344-2932(+)|eukprot:CAMPEP_0172362418 /NCGR_PEP_ID=MMETSP1060-20121228/6018_1 /TAXON_ID=37318 /ORGANISM="Pseudo-nitzschia pungens, Strain cf. cingulata" /LENGTH=862 /DNA_ID=CAMNT_0013084917 /DNA_START=312 /DNA_END=2900 /DNA_ORIENTATION=-